LWFVRWAEQLNSQSKGKGDALPPHSREPDEPQGLTERPLCEDEASLASQTRNAKSSNLTAFRTVLRSDECQQFFSKNLSDVHARNQQLSASVPEHIRPLKVVQSLNPPAASLTWLNAKYWLTVAIMELNTSEPEHRD
jgi:hypothetical protein